MLFTVYFSFSLSVKLFKVLETIIKFIFLLVKLYSKLSAMASIDVVASLEFFKIETNQYQLILIVDDDLPFYK